MFHPPLPRSIPHKKPGCTHSTVQLYCAKHATGLTSHWKVPRLCVAASRRFCQRFTFDTGIIPHSAAFVKGFLKKIYGFTKSFQILPVMSQKHTPASCLFFTPAKPLSSFNTRNAYASVSPAVLGPVFRLSFPITRPRHCTSEKSLSRIGP